MADIEYVGDPARNNKSISREFGGAHGAIKYYIPEATTPATPRIVTFKSKTDEPLDPQQVEVVKTVLIGTGLYQAVPEVPVVAQPPAKAAASKFAPKDGE